MNELFTGGAAPEVKKPEIQTVEIVKEEIEEETKEGILIIEAETPNEEKMERRTLHLIKYVLFGRRRGKFSKKD